MTAAAPMVLSYPSSALLGSLPADLADTELLIAAVAYSRDGPSDDCSGARALMHQPMP